MPLARLLAALRPTRPAAPPPPVEEASELVQARAEAARAPRTLKWGPTVFAYAARRRAYDTRGLPEPVRAWAHALSDKHLKTVARRMPQDIEDHLLNRRRDVHLPPPPAFILSSRTGLPL